MKLGKLIAAAALMACSALAQAQVVELKFVGFVPPKAGSEAIPNWWMDQIESRTNGSVKFRRFLAGSLCKGPEIVACVRDGRADVGSSTPAYTPALFPITELGSLPFVSSDQVAITKGFSNLYEKSPEYRAEHEKLGLRLQIMWAADPMLIATKFPVSDLSAFTGKRIRAVGLGPATFAAALGAQPVAVAVNELYEGLQMGVLAGFTNSFEAAYNGKLYEVTDHWYDPGVGVYAVVGLWISQRSWQRLSPTQQKVVNDVTRELVSGKFMEAFNGALQGTCEPLIKTGKLKVFRKWDDALIKQVKAKVGDSAYKSWEENARKAGVKNPKAIHDTYMTAVRAADQGTPSPTDRCIEAFK